MMDATTTKTVLEKHVGALRAISGQVYDQADQQAALAAIRENPQMWETPEAARRRMARHAAFAARLEEIAAALDIFARDLAWIDRVGR